MVALSVRVLVLLLSHVQLAERPHVDAARLSVQSMLEAPCEIEVGTNVQILSGKYKGVCTGEVISLNEAKGKAKVKRSCPPGPLQKGNGKTWWYKYGQVEPECEMDVEMDVDTAVAMDVDTGASAMDVDTVEKWSISAVKDANFEKYHPLCSSYHDAAPTHALSHPPKLGARLVARRGAKFVVMVEKHSGTTTPQLQMVFLAAPPGVPEDFVTNIPVTWNTSSGGSSQNHAQVSLPDDAPIGEYELRLLGSGGEKLGALGVVVLFNPFSCRGCPEYVRSRRLRSEFMEEYIGGQVGLIWQGLSDDHGAPLWDVAPFRAANLLISLALLKDLSLGDRANPTVISRELSYAIGDRVCYGKWGGGSYTSGQPGGGYQCGKHANPNPWYTKCSDPTEWTGSSPILEQHWALVQAGLPSSVQYCQCFIFSGVTTTVGRSLGLGTRSVTNFQSAHDTNGDRGISKFYFVLPSGVWEPTEGFNTCPSWCSSAADAAQMSCDITNCKAEIQAGSGFAQKPQCQPCKACLPCGNHDSVWSFHVWNEVYFKRTDVDKANGWQAIDATPQEPSGGRYQMGPASLRVIKAGTTDCYDTEFVISEVNADVKLYAYKVADDSVQAKLTAITQGTFEMAGGEPLAFNTRFHGDPFEDNYNTIGFRTVAKSPGAVSDECRSDSKQCEYAADDLANDYKECGEEGEGKWACGADGERMGQGHKYNAMCYSAEQGGSLVQTLDQSSGTQSQSQSSYKIQNRNISVHSFNAKGGDVVADFAGFVAHGPVIVDQPLDIRVKFTSQASAPRTINILLAITVCDQRGMPVISMSTRRMDYVARIQLDSQGNTRNDESFVLPAGGQHTWEHRIDQGLTADTLGTLDIESNDFLEFHFSAFVAETGQNIAFEPRRRLDDGLDMI